MRLVVYEWCCSGGLSGPDARHVLGVDGDVDSLAREGRAMFRAVVGDAVRDPGFEVAALVDATRPLEVRGGVRTVGVTPGREVETLVAAARVADATLVIAPETADVLAARLQAVRAAGGVVLGTTDAFVRLAADKQATIDALAAAGVPVPAGRSLAAGEAWPACFRLPAVRKARGGVGCEGLVVVRPGEPLPCPATAATRLEAWHGGDPVGVSCLLGPRGVVVVAALRQRFAAGLGGYVGGAPLDDPTRRARAERLAVRSIEALVQRGGGPSAGWVGVDMILGPRDDGRDDRVLEVNPRVTASFVGAAAASATSLVRALVDVAAGRMVSGLPLSHVRPFTVADDPSCPLR